MSYVFPVGSRQDLQSRKLQGAVAANEEWELTYGSLNIPLTAERRYLCRPGTECRFGMHRCVAAALCYWDTDEGGEWHWHVIDERPIGVRPGDSVVRLDEAGYTDPLEAVEVAEARIGAYLGTAADA